MADPAVNISGTTERNGSIVVGAPKGARSTGEGTGALGSNYISTPGDAATVTSGPARGTNDAMDIAVIVAKYGARFDDITYYTDDSAEG